MNMVPLNMDLDKKKILIVGGGKVALNKVRYFHKYCVNMLLVSPSIMDEIRMFKENENIDFIEESFKEEHLEGIFMCIITSDQMSVNDKVVELCLDKGILFNDCTDKKRSQLSIPAVVKRGDLSITVSTNGKSPGLSKKIKKELEDQYSYEYEEKIELLGELRNLVLNKEKEANKKREILKRALEYNLDELKNFLDEYKGELI